MHNFATKEEILDAISNAKARLDEYKKLLKEMPEDSILGRMCMMSYIKKYEKAIAKYNEVLKTFEN